MEMGIHMKNLFTHGIVQVLVVTIITVERVKGDKNTKTIKKIDEEVWKAETRLHWG